MGKVRVYSVNKKEKQKIEDEFFEIVSSLRSKQEVFDFMIDLFTESERLMLSRRIQIAKMLLMDMPHDDIRKRLKVGFQTIYKVEHWLRADEKRMKFIAGKIGKFNRKVFPDQITKNNLPRTGLDRYAHHRFLKSLLS